MSENEKTPVIRRLTPLECERLQGFPDGWTDIRWNGKDHSPDGRRYKAIGNSMAVPVMLWIGERLQSLQPVVRDDAAIERILFGTNDEDQLSLF
jgi:DNA (cytosine-5)-methyltransferase 1